MEDPGEERWIMDSRKWNMSHASSCNPLANFPKVIITLDLSRPFQHHANV